MQRGAACGIIIPQPGIELVAPAVEARSLNHWTAREVSKIFGVDTSCQEFNQGSL